MVEVLAGAMLIATTLWPFKVPATTKIMWSAFHQHHLSVLWQDLLKELQAFSAKAESGNLS